MTDHEDATEETVWCDTPSCVRPVTFHPDGMHLTIDGREFADAARRMPHLRLVEAESNE